MAISSRKGCRDERQRRRERDREREAAVETLPAGRADWPFDCWLSEAVFGQQLAAGVELDHLLDIFSRSLSAH